jgi:TolA-binding protein
MRWTLARLLLVVLVAAGLTACDAADQAKQVGQGVDKAKDCADLLSEASGLDFDPQATAAKLDQTARRLDQAIREVDSADVKRAADDLERRVIGLRDAVRRADPAQQRRAFREVTEAAERLARICNVPVDQVTG